MKNKLLQIGLLLSIIGCVVLAIICQNYKSELERVKPVAEVATKNIKTEAKIIGREVDMNGVEHAVTKELNKINQRDFVKGLATDSAGLIDSFSNLANVRLEQILALKQVNFTQKKQLDLAVTDTAIRYKDKFLSLDIRKPKPGEIATSGSYVYNGQLNQLSYFDKKNFFSKKEQYTRYWLADSSATINGVKSLQVVTPLPAEFNVFANAETLPQYNFYGAGVGAEYRKDKLTASASYNYDFKIKKWIVGGKLSYQIFGF